MNVIDAEVAQVLMNWKSAEQLNKDYNLGWNLTEYEASPVGYT